MLPSELWPNRNQRLWGSILTVCLGVWIQPASAQGAAAEVTNARVGQTATLTALVTADILFSIWYRGTAVANSQLICTWFVSSPSQLNGPQYTGRETCQSNGSLVIRDLLTNDTGNYTVIVTPSGALPVTATRQLRVYGMAGTDPSPVGSPGLSVVVIIGIAIAILMVVIIVLVLVYFFMIKKPASGAPAPENTTDAATTAENIQYSSINFMPKGSTPLNPIPAENTLYAVVRR